MLCTDVVKLLKQRGKVVPVVQMLLASGLSPLGVSEGASFQKVLSGTP